MSDLEWEFENVLRAANPPLPPHVRQYRFALPRQYRFDVAWPDLMIAIELDGGTWSGGSHVRGQGYEDGCEKANAAVLRGWRLLRFTTAMVGDNRALATVEELLAEFS